MSPTSHFVTISNEHLYYFSKQNALKLRKQWYRNSIIYLSWPCPAIVRDPALGFSLFIHLSFNECIYFQVMAQTQTKIRYTYIYIYVYIHIYVHIYIYIHICIYTHICTCTYMYMYVYTHVRIYTCRIE